MFFIKPTRSKSSVMTVRPSQMVDCYFSMLPYLTELNETCDVGKHIKMMMT